MESERCVSRFDGAHALNEHACAVELDCCVYQQQLRPAEIASNCSSVM